MFGLSLGHLLILLVVVLLFGSRRLPELGTSFGKALRGFKQGMEGEKRLGKADDESSESKKDRDA